MELNISKFLDHKGQSLLEITITLGVSVAIIVALTITTLQGLQSSQFAQNQILATKYAQEGLEKVRLLKITNTPIETPLDSGALYYWFSNDSLIWSSAPLDPQGYTATGEPINSNSRFAFGSCLETTPCVPENNPSGPGEKISTQFYRSIYLEKEGSGSNAVQVTSRVTWVDFSGTHESKLITILSNQE